MTRRDYLLKTGLGFGGLALTDLLTADSGPLSVKEPHQPAKAKAVIQLFMHGGASHVDTFDYKPELQKRTGETLSLEIAKTIKTSFIHDPTKAILRGSPWEFKPSGQSGLMISELYAHLREHADDLAIVKSCHSNQFDHAPSIYLMSTGSRFPGRPCLGSWVTYGLGSENQNLPAYVVMSDGSTKSGPPAYSAGFLPAVYQGTVFRGGENPILHLNNPVGLPSEAQKDTLDFIGELDRRHLEQGREYDSELEARISSYELAFRMQAEAPEAIDISGESEATKKLYGIDDPLTEDFGRKCLLARRLIERGVRFIQLISGTNVGADWDDAHTDLLGTMTRMCGKTDKPIAGLIADLKSRGMFDDTLVTWSSDFGRTPLSQGATGRDHHPYGFSMWMAGAGIQGGQSLGETDDFGVHAAVDPYDAHDINATLLRVMGLDHERLTYLYQGRDQSLTDVHGQNEFTSRLFGG